MFLVRWVRRSLSLPLLWAGTLSAFLKFPMDSTLLKAAWLVGGDGNVGRMALLAMLKQAGPDITRAQANIWMDRHPRPEIAAVAGLMAVDAGQVEEARDMLARGRACGDDASGGLDFLEYGLASRMDDPAAFEEVLERFQARRDLSPACSKFVLLDLAWRALLRAQWDQAQRLARLLLAVEDVPGAEMALWVLNRHQGDQIQAERHFLQAKFPKPAMKLYYQTIGAKVLSAEQEAAECLAQLREQDPMAAHAVEAMTRPREVPA